MGGSKGKRESETNSRNKVIDCHCHFDMMDSPEGFVNRMERMGHTVIGMTNRPCFFKQGLGHINPAGRIRLALGLHPLQLDNAEHDLADFARYIDRTTYIGEIGLDFSTEGKDTAGLQIECFEEILRLLTGKSKILSIHSRQAERQVLDMLDLFYQMNVIFHWYTGGCDIVPDIVEHGYYFSVNEAMFCSAHGREIIAKIPMDRVLTESDAPYNTRSNIGKAVDGLAAMWRMSSKEVYKIIDNNFRELLKGL